MEKLVLTRMMSNDEKYVVALSKYQLSVLEKLENREWLCLRDGYCMGYTDALEKVGEDDRGETLINEMFPCRMIFEVPEDFMPKSDISDSVKEEHKKLRQFVEEYTKKERQKRKAERERFDALFEETSFDSESPFLDDTGDGQGESKQIDS